jgi:hypothetical protein
LGIDNHLRLRMNHFKNTTSFLLFIILIFQNEIPGQDSTEINNERLYIVAGVSAVGFGLSYGLQNNVWWKGDKSEFHFNWTNDWNADLGADKFGHFYFTHLLTNIYAQSFTWTGMRPFQSRLYAGGVAMLHQTFTEVRDGFSKEYGFSWADYIFNILGAAYPSLQYEYAFLQNFSFKISYEKSARFKQGSHSSIIDDYESTYNWLSINVNNLLPTEMKEYWPKFLNIAVGHSVTNLSFEPQHQLFIGLDWNLKGLPGEGWFWKLLKENLDYYHFPAPTVKIYPNVVWYGLKF